jgi:hypothetical protein
MVSRPDEEKCPSCGSTDIKKLVSRFRRLRSEDERLDEISDRLETMGEPDSPSQMRDMVKEMARATDDDMGEELEELFESDLESEASPSPQEDQ